MADKIKCETCHWFLVPASWRGRKYARTESQEGICEVPAPVIPMSYSYHRQDTVSASFPDCPTWRKR